MGKFLSKIMDALSSLSESSPARILMLGLDAAGKTTILYKLKLNKSINTIPTIGFNVETISPVKGVTFTVWDVGGQEKLRQLWKHYYENTQGLLFVVDSADRVRMPEACKELHGILKTPNMAGVPVVVFANKQDLPGAMAISEVADALHLDQLKDRKWYVHGTCATVGEGIHEGIVELSTYVKEFKKRGYRPF